MRGLLLLVCLLCSCSKPLSDKDCNALLDRYVQMLVSSDRPKTSAGELHKLQVQARSRARSDPAFVECSEQVSRGAFECAMQAPNVDRMEQCLL